MELTAKQNEANELLAGDETDVMLRGGSRSGKSFLICRAQVLRSLKIRSRRVVLRKHFNHCKQSVWYDTLPKVLELCFPGVKDKLVFDKSDWFVKFPNGSEYWFGGLDDKERTEKILGKEFSDIWFNECSEIDWNSRCIAKTRLAERNGLKKKAYYDENPPKRSHWTHKFFIEKVDPVTEKPHDVKVASLLMNPRDNEANIDPNYIKDTLETLPLILRKRFLEGEFWSDDTDIFQPMWIRPGLTGDYVCKIMACDPAISERDGADESAIVTIGIKNNGKIEEIETIHGRWGFNDLIQNMLAVEARHKPTYAGVETVAFQKAVAAVLRKECPSTRWVSLEDFGIKSDVDKIRRAISISYLFERGLITINSPALSKQLLEFEGADEKNDLVDAMIFACMLYKRLWRPIKEENDFRVIDNAQYQRDRVARFQAKQRKRSEQRNKGKGMDPTLGSRW